MIGFFLPWFFGSCEIGKVTMRYRLHRDLVLRGINLKIPSRSKLAFCGRTGCGKSSLFSVLPRLAWNSFWYERGTTLLLSMVECNMVS